MTKTEPNLGNLANSTATGGALTGGPGPAGYTPSERQVICGDIDMRIDRQGQWHYQGSPIGRQELVKLFASVLQRDDVGDHWLITPAEICRITVEDAAFIAVEMFQDTAGAEQCIRFRTNIDHEITVGTDHPIWVTINPETGEPRPYVALGEGLEARLSRSVYYELVDIGVEESVNEEQVYGVWSQGTFFPLGA